MKKILLVDDCDFCNDMHKVMLEEFKYKIYQASNWPNALTYINKLNIDLVLLDYNMPVVDGIMALRAIRTIRCKNELPVIMISDVENNDVVRRAYENGVNSFMDKPVNQEELLQGVNFYLNKN